MNRYSLVCLLVLVLCNIASAQKATVEDNVITAISFEDPQLVESYDVTNVDKGHVYATPRQKSDSTYDLRLFQYMQQCSEQKRARCSHDNPLVSRLLGHGKYSYRLKGRASLQVVFYFNSKYQGGVLMMMDVDRFAPGWGSPVISVRHVTQEQIPHILGKEKNEDQIAAELQTHRKPKSEKSTAQAKVVE